MEDLGEPGDVTWFPDRTWGGRTYMPATAPTSNGYELFGYVSFTREHEGAEATAFYAIADYTDETAEANPDWEWRTAAEDSPEQLYALWHGAVERSRAAWALALADGGLDHPQGDDGDARAAARRRAVDEGTV